MADRVQVTERVGAFDVPYVAWRCSICGRLFPGPGPGAAERHERREHAAA